MWRTLLNDSIATEGYRIGPASNPEALVNLSEIDFEALQAKFAQGHKRTEAEKLKRLIEGKLATDGGGEQLAHGPGREVPEADRRVQRRQPEHRGVLRRS
jgi:hypothetical protein